MARRFTENDLEANYPEDEVKLAATSTLTAAGILAIPFLKALRRFDEAARVEEILTLFAADTDHAPRMAEESA